LDLAPARQQLLDMQAGAGNAAVARMLARTADAAPAAEAPPADAAPAADVAPDVAEVKSGPAGDFGAKIEITPELIALMGGGRKHSGEPDLPSDDKGLTYRKTPGELYVQGAGDANKIDPNDVDQNQLGDCFLMSAIAAVARANPAAIERLIKDNGDGTYNVTVYVDKGWFRKDLQPTVVRVTPVFPYNASGNPSYAGAGDTGAKGPELWVMLIEKAWAISKGGYDELDDGGFDAKAMEGLTGSKSTNDDVDDYTEAELAAKLANALKAHQAVTTSTPGKKKDLDKHGIVGDHVYSVIAVDVQAMEIRLQNPWGSNFELKLSMSVYHSLFDDFSINPAK
jgi:hypothetical protein